MDKNYLVTKSNYFIMNSSYDLSLEEQKIILTLASMVQPTDEEFKPYNFKISDFMELVGVDDKSKYTEIPKITKELMKKVFEIQEGNTIIQTAWLSGVRYEKGSGMVTLKFNPDLKPYMIKLNTVFTQYKLTNILSMRSKYSIRMYEILKANEFKKQSCLEIELEELRKLLKADNVYPLYNDFKRFVIQRTQKELKKLSDIDFNFEEIKTGRKVTSIKFNIKSNRSIDEIAATKVDLVPKAPKELKYIEKVKSIMFNHEITSLEAKKIYDSSKGDFELIEKVYKDFKTKQLGNFVGAMISMVKPGVYNVPKGNDKKIRFNDYEQRSFDPTMEAGLLGWNKQD